MSPSTSSQFQLNPNKKRKKKRGKKKKFWRYLLTWARGQHKCQVDYETRFTHTETDPMDNWRAVFTLGAHLPTPQLLSLSLFLLALFFSLRCAQRWRLLYITFVSPDFQFVCRNLSIWCFSPSDCWNFWSWFPLFSCQKPTFIRSGISVGDVELLRWWWGLNSVAAASGFFFCLVATVKLPSGAAIVGFS
jgi:hypothetical protein